MKKIEWYEKNVKKLSQIETIKIPCELPPNNIQSELELISPIKLKQEMCTWRNLFAMQKDKDWELVAFALDKIFELTSLDYLMSEGTNPVGGIKNWKVNKNGNLELPKGIFKKEEPLFPKLEYPKNEN